MKRRFFAMLLSLAMLFTLAPTAFAADGTGAGGGQTEIPELENPDTSGTSGGIDWKVENGVLTISATSSVENEYTTGQMKDYTSQMGEKVTDPTGWYALKDSITEIKIEEGVTHLGNYAFSYLTNVVRVNIPASITSLGDSIFRGDTGQEILRHLRLPILILTPLLIPGTMSRPACLTAAPALAAARSFRLGFLTALSA